MRRWQQALLPPLLLAAAASPDANITRDLAGIDAEPCPWRFRVYSYEFPEHLPFVQEAVKLRRDGRLWFDDEKENDMFALELLLHRVFQTSCVRTDDPEEATFFFVPFYSDLDFRLNGRQDEPSAYGQAILSAMRGDVAAWEETFEVPGSWWTRRQGWDHIVVFAAPLTTFTHEKSRRGLFHNKKMLVPPIVANVELLNRFVAEYPACGGAKNLLLPYPYGGVSWADGSHLQAAKTRISATYDADGNFREAVGWADAHMRRESGDPWAALEAEWQAGGRFTTEEQLWRMLVLAQKDLFAMATYGLAHGCRPLREAIKEHLRAEDCLLCVANDGRHAVVGSGSNVALGFNEDGSQGRARPHMRAELSHRALFCPCPGGDSPGAKRMYDVVRAGCIPVILSEDFVYPWSAEAGRGDLPEASFSLRIPTVALDGYDAPKSQQNRGSSTREAARYAVADDWSELSWFAEAHAAATAAGDGHTLGAYLRRVSPLQVKALLAGVGRVKREYFDYWEMSGNPVYRRAYDANGRKKSLLAVDEAKPEGGAVRALLDSLAEKAGFPYRQACESELQASHKDSRTPFC